MKLRDSLGRLVQAELLFQRGLPPQATYSFKHSLMHTHAYGGLLRSRRRKLHARVAEVLAKRFPERVDREPEVLARHCEEAERTAEAIVHYRRAAERAQARSAHGEAIFQLRHALQLLEADPRGPERNAREVELQLALAQSLIAAHGYAHVETEAALERAESLSEALGDPETLVAALVALSNVYVNRGEPERSIVLGERALAPQQSPARGAFARETRRARVNGAEAKGARKRTTPRSGGTASASRSPSRRPCR